MVETRIEITEINLSDWLARRGYVDPIRTDRNEWSIMCDNQCVHSAYLEFMLVLRCRVQLFDESSMSRITCAAKVSNKERLAMYVPVYTLDTSNPRGPQTSSHVLWLHMARENQTSTNIRASSDVSGKYCHLIHIFRDIDQFHCQQWLSFCP